MRNKNRSVASSILWWDAHCELAHDTQLSGSGFDFGDCNRVVQHVPVPPELTRRLGSELHRVQPVVMVLPRTEDEAVGRECYGRGVGINRFMDKVDLFPCLGRGGIDFHVRVSEQGDGLTARREIIAGHGLEIPIQNLAGNHALGQLRISENRAHGGIRSISTCGDAD